MELMFCSVEENNFIGREHQLLAVRLAGLRLGSSLIPNRRHSDTSELTNGVAQRQVSIAPDILQAHLQIEH
jgi:hypothetical protein